MRRNEATITSGSGTIVRKSGKGYRLLAEMSKLKREGSDKRHESVFAYRTKPTLTLIERTAVFSETEHLDFFRARIYFVWGGKQYEYKTYDYLSTGQLKRKALELVREATGEQDV